MFFDASSDGSAPDFITAAYSSTLNPSEVTVFIVLRPMEQISNPSYVMDNSYVTNKGFVVRINSGTPKVNLWGYNGSSSITSTDATNFSYNSPYIYAFTISSAKQTIYRNGSLQDSDSVVYSPNTTSAFDIGSANGSASSGFDGYISEFIMFDSVLLTSDRKAVEKYLGKKYAIAVAP